MAIPGYLTQVSAGGAPYVDRSAAAVPAQWRLYERHTNALSLTARDIIEDARLRHWSFSEVQLGDGAALRRLNALQRHFLLQMRDGLKGVMTVTVRTRTQLPTLSPAGTRIGVTPRGTPYVITDASDPSDGYAVYLAEGTGAPYIDLAGVPIAKAPLVDGFPLPVEVISVTALKAVLPDGPVIPVMVTTEQQRSVALSGRRLTAFASGMRIAPLRRPGAPIAGMTWDAVTHVELSYIAVARATALCCLLAFPAVLTEALTAGIAEFFANQSKSCPPAEKQGYAAAARMAEHQITEGANDILGEAPSRGVTYKG